MTSIQVTGHLRHPAGVVWALIGDFGGLHHWHPQVRRLDLSWEGRIRTLHYADGSRTVERLEARNDPARRYVYSLVGGSLPLQACRTRLQVRPHAAHCVVTWSSDFEALGDAGQAVEVAMGATYRAGLDALAALLGSL